MGLLDDLTNTLNKGAAAAERGAKTVKLKAQLTELNKKRHQLAAQLGASLYEATKDDESFRNGREALYDEIAACDGERDECLQTIEAMEQQSSEEAASSSTFVCSACGSSVSGSDLFCSGCGTSVEQIKNALEISVDAASNNENARVCSSCGTAVSSEDAFCMECGNRIFDTPDIPSDIERASGKRRELSS